MVLLMESLTPRGATGRSPNAQPRERTVLGASPLVNALPSDVSVATAALKSPVPQVEHAARCSPTPARLRAASEADVGASPCTPAAEPAAAPRDDAAASTGGENCTAAASACAIGERLDALKLVAFTPLPFRTAVPPDYALDVAVDVDLSSPLAAVAKLADSVRETAGDAPPGAQLPLKKWHRTRGALATQRCRSHTPDARTRCARLSCTPAGAANTASAAAAECDSGATQASHRASSGLSPVVECAFSYAALCESALVKGITSVEAKAAAAMPRVRSAGRAAKERAVSLVTAMQASLDAAVHTSLDAARSSAWLSRMLEARGPARRRVRCRHFSAVLLLTPHRVRPLLPSRPWRRTCLLMTSCRRTRAPTPRSSLRP